MCFNLYIHSDYKYPPDLSSNCWSGGTSSGWDIHQGTIVDEPRMPEIREFHLQLLRGRCRLKGVSLMSLPSPSISMSLKTAVK